MQPVRRLLAQRRLALLLCAAALLLKLLVPSGYMIASEHGHLTITVCSGSGARTVTMAMPGMHAAMPSDGKTQDHGKAELPCAFAGLSAAALGAIDPILLVALVAFILAAALCPAAVPAPVGRRHLRPPLRGPPAIL